MQLTLLAEGSEHLRDIGAPAIVYGLLAFAGLLTLLLSVLAVGKGRPHS